MKIIDKAILDSLSTKAADSARGRMNLNYHDNLSDTLQRLLNAMEPGTYVQPHKHDSPDKREFFTILRGKALVVTFFSDGKIKEHFLLDPSTENMGVEIPAKEWHTIIVLSKGTVLFEVKDGPYQAIDDKNFAEWAPKEGDPDCDNYLQSILGELQNILD
jgi:cupin fold WbuC family metalloprotein